MISVDACRGKRVTCNLPADQIGALLREPKQMLWVDVCAPAEEDWDLLGREFRFHPLAVEDARKQNQRPKVDPYEGYLFLTVRSWTGVKGATDDLNDATQEIDLFLGPNYLVTIHDKDCPPITEARARWERHPAWLPREPAFLLYVLLDSVVDGYFPVMDAIDEEMDALETAAYSAEGRVDIAPGLILKKRLLLLRQTVSPLRDALNQLLRADQPLIPPATRPYLQDVYDHTLRLVEQVDLHRDIVTGVLDAIISQTSNRLNEVMKRLTAITALFLPITAITGFFGMNIGHLEKAPSWAIYLSAGLMLAASGGVWLFFRRRGWW